MPVGPGNRWAYSRIRGRTVIEDAGTGPVLERPPVDGERLPVVNNERLPVDGERPPVVNSERLSVVEGPGVDGERSPVLTCPVVDGEGLPVQLRDRADRRPAGVRVGALAPAAGLAAVGLMLALALARTDLPRSPTPSGRALGATVWWNPDPKALQLPGSRPFSDPVFAPDGRIVAATDAGGRIQLWDTASGRMLERLSGPSGTRRVMFSPDGLLVSAVGRSDDVRIWETATGRPRLPLAGARAGYLPAGHALVSGDATGRVRIWTAGVREPAPVLVLKDSPVADLAVSPDARTLAVRTEDGVTRVQDLVDDRLLTLPTEGHGALVFSPDGRTLITGSDVTAETVDPGPALLRRPSMVWTVQVWDVITGGLRSTRTVSARSVSARRGLPGVVFSPDGRMLATGGRAEGIAQIEDADTGRVRHELTGLQDETVAVLSPDGRRLATGNRNCLRVWDLATGSVRLSVPAVRSAGAPQLAFSPDGRVLAVLGQDADLQLWMLS